MTQCIYIAKHYMVAVSSVWDGLLNDDEQSSGKKTSKSKDGTRQRVFLVPEKSFEDVLEFWCICYCSDDAVASGCCPQSTPYQPALSSAFPAPSLPLSILLPFSLSLSTSFLPASACIRECASGEGRGGGGGGDKP